VGTGEERRASTLRRCNVLAAQQLLSASERSRQRRPPDPWLERLLEWSSNHRVASSTVAVVEAALYLALD